MKNCLAAMTLLAVILTSVSAHAACTREDITFYLSKGFTQDQVTAICTAAGESVQQNTTTATTQSPADTDIAAAPAAIDVDKEAEKFLQETVNGYDVYVEDGVFHYTAKLCIPYGRYNNKELVWDLEACEPIRHAVTLRGMTVAREVISLKLFQPRQIYLKGKMEREFANKLKKYKSLDRKTLIRNLDKQPRAIVPIRENASRDQVMEALRKIAI